MELMKCSNKRLFEILRPFIESQDDDEKEAPELDELLLDLVQFANDQQAEMLNWCLTVKGLPMVEAEMVARIMLFVLGEGEKEIERKIKELFPNT